MSAQALLSLFASAAPTAPQGAPTAEASSPDGLFASLLGGALSAGESEAALEADNDETEVAGFLNAPAMIQPTPPALVLVPEAAADTIGMASSPAVVTAEAPAASAQAGSPAPFDEAVSDPAAEAVVADVEAAADIALTTAAQGKAESATQAVAAPSPVSTPVAPHLRPLAERTAKPLDADRSDASTGSEPSIDTAASARPEATSGASGKPAAPGDAPPAPAATAKPDTSSNGALNAPVTDVQSAGPEGTHAARDTGLSHMSRAAIDATAQIAAQIIRKLEGRSTRFEMALTPDDLGRVDVKLDIDTEGRLAARLAFDNPAAATDLRGRADELRRQLEAQGFHLADDAFEFTQRDSGSHAFDRGQDPRGGQSRAFSAAARLNAETDAQPARWTSLSLSPSGVDMKV